jgi:hypothetical protein
MYIKAQTTNQSIFFNFKSPLYYIFGVYMLQFNFIDFFFSIENLNLTTNLENYHFYTMLIACKCTPFCKTLDYNAKSEPPYLATTFENDWSI